MTGDQCKRALEKRINKAHDISIIWKGSSMLWPGNRKRRNR